MNAGIRFEQIATHAEGEGVPVVMLHGWASDGRQWRSLSGCIAGRYQAVAVDLPGYGGSRGARGNRASSLAEIAASLRPLVVGETPVHLVGHSFGGAVALKAASMFPGHVRSLTLIEPACIGALWTAHGADRQESWRLRAAIRNSATALAEGDAWSAMRHLIDFWNGEGAWMRTSFGLRQTLSAHAGQVHADYAAVAADRPTAHDLASVVCPVLSLRGAASPAVAGAVADHLRRTLPFVRHEEIAGAGHMLPLTDPHVVDPMIADFLVRVDRGWQERTGPVALAA